MEPSAQPGLGDVLAQIVTQIGFGPFLIGLCAICSVLAYNIFAARAASALLSRIGAGAEIVSDRRSGRAYYINSSGRRVYRPDHSDYDGWKAWHAKVADNRIAYENRGNSSVGGGDYAPSRSERAANRELYEARRSASYRSKFGDDYDDQRRSRGSDEY